MAEETDTDTEETEAKTDVNVQLQMISKLASNPVALIAYAIVFGFGGGYIGGDLEEDLDDHVHEEQSLPDLRRHWTPDERIRLAARLEDLERKVAEPIPVDLDADVERRLRDLEVEIGAAIRILELSRNSSPDPGGHRP